MADETPKHNHPIARQEKKRQSKNRNEMEKLFTVEGQVINVQNNRIFKKSLFGKLYSNKLFQARIITVS